MTARNKTGRSAQGSCEGRGLGRKRSGILILCFSCLAAWSTGTLSRAQQGPMLDVPPPPPPPVPRQIKPAAQLPVPEPIKLPNTVADAKLPQTKAKANDLTQQCPPVSTGKNDLFRTEACDQNVPVVACPSPSDLAEAGKFVDNNFLDPKTPLTLYAGRTRLMVFKQPPTRIQIGDEKIVGYTLISPKQLSLLGSTKDLGSTVLNLWFRDPADKAKEIVIGYLIRVVPDPETRAELEVRYKMLAAQINKAFPDSRISLNLVGDKLTVSGQAKDVADAVQILRIARSVAPREPDAKLPFNLGSVTLEPYAPGRNRFQDLMDAAGPHIINLLRIPGEQMVTLRVTVAEVNRSAARSIGLNFTIANKQGLQVFANNTGNINGSLSGLGVFQGFGLVGAGGGVGQIANNLPAALDNGQIILAINAMRNLGYARTLAEPSLEVINGQTGTFHVGGEYPIPIVTGATSVGLQGVEFKPFGVQLTYTPTITDRDRIRLNLSFTVSTRDLSSGASFNGANVAGLNTRNFQTTVELRDGQTMAVAGMIQNNLGTQASRVPLLGDLPVVGRIFAFDQINAGEQELVVLVTPEFSHPLCEGEVPPLPGSDIYEPGDLEFYLLGRLESRRQYDYRSPVRTDLQRMRSYHRCEQLYIIGPSGHSEQK